MKHFAVAAALLLLMSSGAATSHTEDLQPGLVKAGSPLYGVEVAVDNTLVRLGVMDPGQVAFERASEVALAHQRGNNDAMNNALDHLDNVSEAATSGDTEALNQSISVLQGLNETAPEEAQQGLSTALESVRNASERQPSNLTGDLPIPDEIPSVSDFAGGGEKPTVQPRP
jgi:hypothetical protein